MVHAARVFGMKMLVSVALAGLLASLALGCRRKREPQAAPASEPVASTEAAAAAQPPKTAAPQAQRAAASPPTADFLPTAPPDASLRLPVQRELTGAIHLYQMDHHKLPADFATLVKERYLTALPKPPPGKRFALDRNRLQVVIMD